MQTLEDWLSQLGLSKYMQAFVENDVDLRALLHITEADLQELGVSLGHRRIILAAINGLAQPSLDGSPLASLPLPEVGPRSREVRFSPVNGRVQFDLSGQKSARRRITVSGLTIFKASSTPGASRYNPANTRRSMPVKVSRCGDLRRSTLS
jgi:hypothetical protein